ncbi:MAG: hypothetical protein HYR90_00450 [Candidatus Andersenbacteria bacterium]|nr:hypothetical protein [Candidatus Andersenbacteria bacterium]MBI3250703.1 hypothetical protein [Candidatus Andersenbacteria bacterium]
MEATPQEKQKAGQIIEGITISCLPFLLLIFFVIPFTFLFVPGRSGSLLGGAVGERLTLDFYLYYSAPFVLLFLAVIGYGYRRTKNSKPVFAKSLLTTALILVGLNVVFMGLVAYSVYT